MLESSPLEELGLRIWDWRARHQPRTRDDIPRLDRPAGWRPDFSAATVAAVRAARDAFAAELAAVDPGSLTADVIDHRLLSSLLDRVTWELDVLRAWQCQPRFYIDQALGTVFDALLRPGVDAARVLEVVRLLLAVPSILADGRSNLAGHAVAEFAQLAIDELADIDDRCADLTAALGAVAPTLAGEVRQAGEVAAEALLDFRDALIAGLPGMVHWQPVGSEQYQWFLTNVAVLPFTPGELLAIGTAELDRAITLEQLERGRRHANPRPAPVLPADTAAQVGREAELEQQVRDFYVEHGLLTQPDSLRHYLIAAMPDHLEPLRFLGVADDLTSPTRLDEDGVSYTPPPGPDLPYFYAANAIDPRAGIVHEGVHYQQLSLSWSHDRPLRRHYYDSGANEGIAFYNEEMMLASGLFDEVPRLREVMYNFMRLRALRVEVDVRLAIGELDIAGATAYLRDIVPMDTETAAEEATFFAACPGQAMTYQIGKSQILRLFADAVRAGGFDLQRFHDRLWLEGNVPLSLQRWELLDDDADLRRIDELRSIPAH